MHLQQKTGAEVDCGSKNAGLEMLVSLKSCDV